MSNEEVLRDDYATPDEKEAAAHLIILEKQAHEGALFEDWMRHQAGLLFAKFLEDEINDSKNKWLGAADREQAEKVRIQAQVYLKVRQWISAHVAAGKVASIGIRKYQEEGAKLENWIVDHSQNPK